MIFNFFLVVRKIITCLTTISIFQPKELLVFILQPLHAHAGFGACNSQTKTKNGLLNLSRYLQDSKSGLLYKNMYMYLDKQS